MLLFVPKRLVGIGITPEQGKFADVLMLMWLFRDSPPITSREQSENAVQEVIASLSAKTVKDMGPVMKEVIARTAGAADNKTVSEVIKSKLS